jgi:uncharacterized protein (DUF488 family)
MKPELDDLDPMEDPEAVLEMMLINQYLKSQGYSYKELSQLPCEVARKLMIDASRFASSRLAEISARTKFKDEIHRPGGES